MNSPGKTLFRHGLVTAFLAAAALGCSDTTTQPKPVAAYPNAQLLVSGAALQATLGSTGPVIVDTRSATAYAAGHIPGAVSIPIAFGGGTFDRGGTGTDATDLKTPDEIGVILGGLGLSRDTKIVICGADIDPLAGRMFWMLEYVGATHAAILDGGFAKWSSDGRPTSTDPNSLPAATFTPSVVASRLATKADVLAHYADTDHYAVVDQRNVPDWAAARIPHAVNILVGEVLNPDLTMKTSLELQTLFDSRGVTAGKFVFTHCYVGYRSSQGYYVFRLMGYDVSQYDGSWTDWNADPNTPKEM